MSEGKAAPLPHGVIRQMMLAVECPVCAEIIEDIDVFEDDWGAWTAEDDAQFPLCEMCGTQFEIAPLVTVTRAEA